MKKILSILLCSLLIFPLSGCSNKLIEAYPEIEDDFNKKDYDKLAELSNEYSLSYDELKEKFATELTSGFKSKVEDNDLGAVTLDKISSSDDKTVVKYSVTKERDWGTTGFSLTYNFDKNNSIKSIEYKENKYNFDGEIFNILEGNNIDDTRGDNIYSSVSDEKQLENNIYIHSSVDNYYYLPQENNIITLYANKEDLPEKYISQEEYFDGVIRQADKDLKKMRDHVGEVEGAFGVMDDAMRESNH